MPIDNLVLTRLAAGWSSTLAGARLGAFTQESGDRFRIDFALDPCAVTLVVCLDPKAPWMGSHVRRWAGPRWSPEAVVSAVARALVGRRLERCVKLPADRAIRLDFGGGTGLAIELAPHGVNLVLLGDQQVVVDSLRRSKAVLSRLAPGQAWTPRAFPAGRLDPFLASPEAVDEAIDLGRSAGEPPADALRRRLVGVGAVGAALVIDEHLATGRTPGAVLRARLDEILAGTSEVLIEGADDATFERLLPWRPVPEIARTRLFSRGDAAETAAWFHESRSEVERTAGRIEALGRILRTEFTRTREAEWKVREGLRSFADPERHRLMGEALLAGLRSARRSGDVVVVPDPYDADGRELAIPAAPDKPLSRVADELFEKHRRAKRGLQTAGARAESLRERSVRLEALMVLHERTLDESAAAELEAAMRAEGLPVGLVGPTRSARAAARVAVPQLAGVRLVTTKEGWTILVGRTGKDNDRLTFKIAAPDDIWLHAAGVPGAHVIVRNPERLSAPPPGTLTEAAQLALWFSEARSEAAGDVQWTRRKYVKRARGGASGRVVLKRFETIRVHARPPAQDA